MAPTISYCDNWAKFQRHHEKPHQKAGKRCPSVGFKAKWGPMVVFDNQGKTVSLALPTKKQEWLLHATLLSKIFILVTPALA